MFDLQTFTILHTAISLVALVAGIALLLGMAGGRALPGLASFTILTLVLTSATGFGFPFVKFLPSHAFGILSLLVLAVTVWARWGKQLVGGWRTAYGASLAFAVYLDAFVAVVQAFLKVPALNAIAPTQQSPGFIVAQTVLLVVFVALGFAVVRGLRRGPASATALLA